MSCVSDERSRPLSFDKDVMHISNLIGPNGKKAPAVFWRKTANQYMTYIGFRLATKGKRRGKRVRAMHYLGRDEREALLNALLLDRRWDKIVAEEKVRISSLEAQTLRGHSFFEGSNLPVWPTAELQERRAQSLEDLNSGSQVIVAEAGEEDRPVQVMTLAALRQRFLNAQKTRIGLTGRRGLKEGTYRELVKATKTALKAIDVSTNALSLTRDHCRQISDYWSSKDREICERTAGNYCKAFLRMITWADSEEIGGFVMPKIKGLFVFSNGRGKNLPFEQMKMRALFLAATLRCRLYLLLGLNTGYTQVDIANLKRSEIIEINGDTFIVRRRDKTSHQNDFVTMHYLWPETAALLKQQMAPNNPDDLALLNVNGQPLLRNGIDNIKDSVIEVRDTANFPEFTFKQLRKYGASAMHRLTSNQDIARQYAGHRISGVLSRYVRDDFFDPLTAALKVWGEELRGQGILESA
jgi:hypothetical protein